MPAANTGFPWSTKWKNYRYPLTRISDRDVYSIDTQSGYFLAGGLDIWIEHDYVLEADILGSYRVIMTGGIPDECNTIYRPNYFLDGTTGLSDASAATSSNSVPWFQVGGSDTVNAIDSLHSTRATQSSIGNNQSLYMIVPGLYIGFVRQSSTGWSTNDEFAFTLKPTILDGIPKIMDGTYTAYCKMPLLDGDRVFTHDLPSSINNKSATLSFHLAPDFPKAQETGAENCAIDIIIEGSVDGINFVEISKIIDDWNWKDDGINFAVTFDSNAIDGADYPYKRFQIVHTEGGVSGTSDLQPHNWIKMAITPN